MRVQGDRHRDISCASALACRLEGITLRHGHRFDLPFLQMTFERDTDIRARVGRDRVGVGRGIWIRDIYDWVCFFLSA